MKIRHKKVLLSSIAVVVAGILGIGALLESSISVQASSAMMPGIEEILNEASQDAPFRILEIVDSEGEAELGYYISGQEPYIKLYKYADKNGNVMKFSSLKDGLSKLPEKERREFATNEITDENGNISYTGRNIRDLCGDSVEEYPLAYSDYEEQYFVSSEDGWEKVDFVDADGNSRTDTVKIKGHYQENTAGNGNYTKQEQTYYPIRKEVDEDNAKPDKYRENIENFYYSDGDEAQAPYALEFKEVDNEDVNNALADENDKGQVTILPEYDYTNGKYGYYENVYADLTEEIALDIEKNIYKFPGENPTVSEDAVLIQDNTPQGAVAFTAGTEEDFTAVNDGSEVSDSTTESDFGSGESESFSEDAFSSGEISDGVSSGETQAESGQNPDSEGSQTEDGTNPDSDNTQSENGTQNDANKSTDRTILIGFADEETKGSTENPYIYLGENIEAYPYYKYTLVGDLKKVKELALENQKKDAESVANNTEIVRKERDITLGDGQYWYWQTDKGSGQLSKYPLSIVSGRQSVPYSDIKKIDSSLDYNYYYTVEKAYFCCKASITAPQLPTDYQYYGWYYASYPQNDENVYIKVSDGDGKAPTHYISDAEYKLTPGTGDYDFVPNEEEEEQNVEVNHMYYKGGYVNHDWFKRYVFHLSPKSSDETATDQEETVKDPFKAFNIEVVTMTTEEFNRQYGNGVAATSADGTDISEAVVSAGENAEAENGDEPESDHTDGNGEEQESNSADINEDVQESNSADINEDAQENSSTDINNDTQEDNDIEENNNNTQDTSDVANEENVQTEDNGETSEVESMISEAGVELVSIEKEISDNSNNADDFQDGTENGETEENTVSTDALSDGGEAVPEFTDDSGDTGNAFSAGETSGESDTASQLSEYDLIYVNGTISANAAQAIGKIPVMINSVKAAASTEFLDAFSSFANETDADGHYVNTYVYFFKNTFSQDDPSGLININFDTNFNSEAGGSAFTDANATEGFEEILEYIESENQYRKLGTAEKSDGNDSNISDGKIELLSSKISQARAIEYIINYQYKRNLLTKDEINVLEIEPAKSSGYLSEESVNSWLGNAERDTDFIKSYSVCCAYDQVAATNGDYAPASNMFDGKSSTIWHSDWKNYLQGHPNNESHYINVKFKKKMTITGFDYLPREGNSNGAQNGKVKDFILHVYSDEDCKTELYSESYFFDYTDLKSDHQLKKFRFANGKSVSDVRSAKIEILSAGDDKAASTQYLSKRYASCAELSFSTKSETWTPDINIDVMTASEYVGHIDDINSKYDMIYIGNDDSARNDLINGVSPMLYTHVGAAVNVNSIHDLSQDIKKLSLMGMLNIDYVVNSEGKKMMQDTRLYNIGENGETTYPGLGSFRGSGNDITNQQYEELMDFVKSGYPVILADSLVDNGLPSTKTVDNSSYYYRFIKDALSYSNVSTTSNLKNMDLSFFTKLSKPVIEFTDNGKPLEVPRVGEFESSSNGSGYLTGENLRYEFVVKNDSEAYPANTTYNCELFFDLNFDGNLSRLEEQDKYMEIQDEDGNVLTKTDGVYQLKINHRYIVTRKIPEDYFKVITWKLQLTSNVNSSVRTSVMGYAKRKKNSKQTINVLQIIPTKPSGGADNLVTWNLYNAWDDKNSTFYRLMNAVEDFTLDIKTVTVTEYEEDTSVLDDRQMLILGFGDIYENIKNDEGQVDKIVKFIQDGKSVIFTHDTTSNMNWNYKEFTSESNPVTVDGKAIKDGYLWRGDVNRKDWGYSLNTLFRTISGLDRYGITNTKETSVKNGSTSISALLKQGNMLSASDTDVDFSYMEQMAGDVAYVTNSNCSQSYMQTQGYVNKEISKIKSGQTVTQTTKVNDGVITEYPYKLPDDLTVAGTHGQYYQLALEKDRDINGVSDGKNDIVVWYCLSGNYYQDSPNDVRNNYYFYSRGNVIYTGVGHSTVTGEAEIKLFINAIVAAANVTAVKPEVNFITELNPAAKIEKTRYYATDQTSWNQDEINVLNNDQEFFINVKDYNMVSSSLSLEDQSKEDMRVDFYIGGTEESNKINDKIREMIPYGNNVEPVRLSDGSFHIENNAYRITLSDIEQYLWDDDAGSYLPNCKLYVKVTSTVSLYGKNITSVSEASIDLKQRQLFDLD